MKLDFREITLEEAPRYIEHWNMCEERTSDYCFPVIWSLGPDYGTKSAYDESTDLYWLHQDKSTLFNLAPIGNWRRDDWPQILHTQYGDECEFSLVPEKLANIWASELAGMADVEIIDERGTWEYLYNVSDLASLAGNRYMRKRNRVNQFRKNYEYTYEPLTEDLMQEITDFQDSWYLTNSSGAAPGLMQENNAIRRVLTNWSRIPNICGGVIKIGGRIAAYTIGELAGDTVIVHYEKASLEYGAAYQAINKEFMSWVAASHPEVKIANREEDMNDAGLRAAKMSYLPIGFIKECTVKIKFI